MELLGQIGLALAGIVSILGILGGLFSLPLQFRKLRRDLQFAGNRGHSACVVSRADCHDAIVVTYLVEGDLFHFLRTFGHEENLGSVQSIDSVGEYYKVLITYPPGTHLQFRKTRSKWKPL